MRESQQELRNRAAEIEDMNAAADLKDADNSKLWDQVCCPSQNVRIGNVYSSQETDCCSVNQSTFCILAPFRAIAAESCLVSHSSYHS